ncbi:hypothetical protein F7725_015628 [Dissostichus mawsoni]|uniref:Uncharacterized protein n=1 Tax=Dissostichus mawsoni TaxID=36200 RepID=A0A7J5YJI2_DISMA|nr:hypothetical protein F7725_015628 [Dissostichus mawsoni]
MPLLEDPKMELKTFLLSLRLGLLTAFHQSAERRKESDFVFSSIKENISIGRTMSKPGEKYRLNEDHGRKQSSSLANGMDSHPGCGSAEKRGHHCRSYKLIIDPALKKDPTNCIATMG